MAKLSGVTTTARATAKLSTGRTAWVLHLGIVAAMAVVTVVALALP